MLTWRRVLVGVNAHQEGCTIELLTRKQLARWPADPPACQPGGLAQACQSEIDRATADPPNDKDQPTSQPTHK